MHIISHRANKNGPHSATANGISLPENHPDAIRECLAEFFVEVDVHAVGNRLWLGHDGPQFEAPEDILENSKCIFHAKNLEAIPQLVGRRMHWFWHETDKLTITNRGLFWCYPGTFIDNPNTILLDFGVREETLKWVQPWRSELPKALWGVCTDYPYQYEQANTLRPTDSP